MSHQETHVPTIMDIQEKALLLPGRPQFWTSHHMAEFYQTTSARIIEQFRRNPDRFPSDFWFELREDEKEVLVTHFAIPNRINRGVLIGFTKCGALAFSGVLRTPVANAVSVQIVRAIVAMEEVAIRDAKIAMSKLTTEWLLKKPVRARLVAAWEAGMGLTEFKVANPSYTFAQIEAAVRELMLAGLIHSPLHGMQQELFGNV